MIQNVWRCVFCTFIFHHINVFFFQPNYKPMEGIHTPFIYVGEYLTSFAAHVEDGDLYSVNYNHSGAAKIWYIIPGEEGEKLEKLIFNQTSHICKLYIRHKSILVPPSVLKEHGIKFARIVQKPGQYVIVFPRSYHMGFNCGLNIAEAINFATPNWLQFFEKFNICECS